MKLIFLSSYDDNRFTKFAPDQDNDSFYTYGWNAKRARILKKYYPEYEIEVWRFSKNSVGYFEKRIEDIQFKIYPAFRIKYFIDISLKGFRDLLRISKNEPILISLGHLHKWLVYTVAVLFKYSPIIVEDYGEIPPQVKALSKNPLKRILYKFNMQIEKLVFKNIDFFFWGDLNKIQYIKQIFPEFKGEIMPSFGFDLNLFHPMNKVEAKQKLRWDINKKFILYVGRLEKIKNVDVLINVWKEIHSEMAEVELVIVGANEADPFYNLALECNVTLYPKTMNYDLPIYYSAADVYVLFTLDNGKFSGMGIAPGESLACGTPVVSGGMRNAIGGKLDGIGEAPQSLTEYKAAIIKVLGNSNEYTKCREFMEQHYTQEAISKRFERAIKQVLMNYY